MRHPAPELLSFGLAGLHDQLEQNQNTVPGNFPEGDKGRARDQAAKAFGISGPMVDAADTVATKGAPELVDAVKQGKIAVTAAKELTALPLEKQVEVVGQGKKEAVKVANELSIEEENNADCKKNAENRSEKCGKCGIS